jgi:hypothetical protein
MSQQSEELLPDSTAADPDAQQSARILHMKSRHYDLQRAILQRAQESVEREASLDAEKRRPKPLKWLIIFAIACLPIVVTLVMVDGFLRAFHQYLYTTTAQQAEQAEREAAQAPAETTFESSRQPGVVLLQPLTIPEPAPAGQATSQGSTSDSTATPRN